jgi:predicted MFS family arabinose efflux permease
MQEEAAVSAFWPQVPALPSTTTAMPPQLKARGEIEEEMGEATITAIVLVVVVCLLPLAVLLVRLSRKSRFLLCLFLVLINC